MAKYRRQWFWGVSIPLKTIWNFIGIILIVGMILIGKMMGIEPDGSRTVASPSEVNKGVNPNWKRNF
jgi:hypothetical protein